jgi:N-acetylglutamate synthase-like GNAT family acetyltransferase
MEIVYKEFENLTKKLQYQVAQATEDYTFGRTEEIPQMLPTTKEEVFAKYLGYIAFSGDNFAGYIAAIKPVVWRGREMTEVGSLWVPSGFRSQGIAHNLVGLISGKLTEASILPYAFCNRLSLPIFESSGYKPAKDANFPPEAHAACQTCPTKPRQGCCDEKMIYIGGYYED